MHVLVVASEEFVPPDNPTSGIFERDQALALLRQGVRVGVLSVKAPFPLWPAVKRLARDAATFSGDVRRSARELERSVAGLRSRAPRITQEAGLVVCHATDLRTNFTDIEVETAARAEVLDACFKTYAGAEGVPDVVHVHNALSGGTFAAALAADRGVPFVVTEHSSAFARSAMSDAARDAVAAIYAAARVRIVVSPSLGETLTTLGLGTEWNCIPNVIAPELVAANATSAPPGPTTFLNVGSLDANKDQRGLLRAFGIAMARSKDEIRLRIVGEGPDREDLAADIHALGIARHVTLVGHIPREQVAEEMRNAHALVIASRVETFGAVAIEALAAGRPVIATRSGGPEFIVDGTCGVLVPPGDPEAMAEALVVFTTTKRSYDARALRESAMSRFGPDAIGRKLVEVYEAVID